jgi:hypothetical protein
MRSFGKMPNRERRSVADDAVADPAPIPELRRTRVAVVERVRASSPAISKNALDPVRIIRKDRSR